MKRPDEVERELERLASEAQAARGRLGELVERLTQARGMLIDARRLLGGGEAVSERTPEPGRTQDPHGRDAGPS